jgi:Tfp pilus assembly protein PilF
MKVEQNTHEKVMAEIKEKTAKADCSTDTYFDAAEYYLDNNHDLKQALVWADKVVEKDKQYWTYNLRANILAKLGQCAKAAEDAKMTVEMAKKEGDDSYVKRGEKVLKQCAGK